MLQRPAGNLPCRRHRLFRRSAVTVAVIVALGAGQTGAVTIDQVVWGSDNAAYNTYASTCPSAGGTQCGLNSPTNPVTANSSVIFSWGTSGTPQWNSVFTWTNAGAAFNLSQIHITANGTVGTGLASTPTGSGAAPNWELSNGVRLTKMTESMIRITAGSNSAYSTNLFSGYTTSQNWYNESVGTTRQTPVNFTFDASGILSDTLISTGDTIRIRLYESVWNGSTQNIPDLQFAPMTIAILGDPLATPPTLSANDLSFGNVRIGTTSAPGTVTVSNSGGTAADSVTLTPAATPATNPFAPSSQVTLPASIAASGTGTQTYTYTPSDTGGSASAVAESHVVNLASTTAGTTSTPFTLSGNAVGPVFDLSGTGVTGTTIDLGQVTVGTPETRYFTIANLFGTDISRALTNMTIINVGIEGTNAALFEIVGSFDNTEIAATHSIANFGIKFTPIIAGLNFTALLKIQTDVGAALGANGDLLQFTLLADGIAGPTPTPATLLLLGAGLWGLRFGSVRRRV